MGTTGIPYLTRVWNPTTGCSPVSAGCDNCWARAYLRRFGCPRGGEAYPNDGPCQPRVLRYRLDEPLRWRKPQIVGVSFMGDLFHEEIPFDWIRRVFVVMARATQHRFLLLTKRPQRYAEWFRWIDHTPGKMDARLLSVCACQPWPLRNVWVGVSVEEQATADERVPVLLGAPAAHWWLSLEPQLGPVDLARFTCDARRIDWVVQGCESGPRRRPFDVEWARSVRDRLAGTTVGYYLKQMPRCCGHANESRNTTVEHLPPLDGQRYANMPGT